MTAWSGVNNRTTEGYWELSGPERIARNGVSCRACRKPIYKNEEVMVRDGRKLRFFYHAACFRGSADPRTQDGSTFETKPLYHKDTAPDVSGLQKNRKVFQPTAPKTLGKGKWSVRSRGFRPTGRRSTAATVEGDRRVNPRLRDERSREPTSKSSSTSLRDSKTSFKRSNRSPS